MGCNSQQEHLIHSQERNETIEIAAPYVEECMSLRQSHARTVLRSGTSTNVAFAGIKSSESSSVGTKESTVRKTVDFGDLNRFHTPT